METLGERIKRLRVSYGMTQEDLGEMLGVKKAAIQKYENGGIVNLKTETIEKLAEIFNVGPSYIMGWEKFDDKYDLNEIKKELMLIETLEKDIGTLGLLVIGMMYMMNDDGKTKILEYAKDIQMIDKYIDDEKKKDLLERYPTSRINLYITK